MRCITPHYLPDVLSVDQSVAPQLGTTLIADNPDDKPLTNFRLSLQAASSGIRLLFPF